MTPAEAEEWKECAEHLADINKMFQKTMENKDARIAKISDELDGLKLTLLDCLDGASSIERDCIATLDKLKELKP